VPFHLIIRDRKQPLSEPPRQPGWLLWPIAILVSIAELVLLDKFMTGGAMTRVIVGKAEAFATTVFSYR
jgi:hypothetical protein